MKTNMMKLIGSLALAATLLLGACGGGGDLAPCGSGSSLVNAILDQGKCSTSPAAASATAASGSLTLSLTDAAGAAVTAVSPDHAGTLKALVVDSKGVGVPSVAVTFTTSDKTGNFVPSSGTALTDASGVASVGLPAGTQAGAFTVTANAAAGGKSVAGTVGYTVAFPTLTLSALSMTPATLSAGGNASVSVTVSSGSSAYATPLPVTFTSPCVASGKATIGTPVLTQNGIALASYTDKGCGVADAITASVALGGMTVSRTGSITVLPATAGSIKFLTADTTNIALKGTGGFGRQEFSTLKFQVFDTTGNAVSGKLVNFSFADKSTEPATTLGGLALNPASATSAADGTVTTLVSGGAIPTSVRVVATINASAPPITTLSNILVVSTGVPDKKHFSLASTIGNCEGRDFNQYCSTVTATLADHFGNPVPDGTAVNFTIEGNGAIEASCVTGSLPEPGATPAGQTTNSKVGPGSGSCSVALYSSDPRLTDGRATVLAYALGEEDFFDANGNNICDNCDNLTGPEFTPANDMSPDIFRDDNEDGVWTAGEPCIGPNGNASCSTPGDGKYNGVLRSPPASTTQTLYVSDQLVQIFSGSHATVTFNPTNLVCPVGGTADVQVTVTDQIGNIMPAGTTIAFSTFFGFGVDELGVYPASVKVNNVVLAVGQPLLIPTYTVSVACAGNGKLFATVTTPSKVETSASIQIGIPIN